MEKKEAGRGQTPWEDLCLTQRCSHGRIWSGDSLSECPRNPGKMAWEQTLVGSGKAPRHSTVSECPAVHGIAGTELEERPQMGRQTLHVSPWIRPVYMSLGLGPLLPPHHSQLCMDSRNFKRAQPPCHTQPLPWGFSVAVEV